MASHTNAVELPSYPQIVLAGSDLTPSPGVTLNSRSARGLIRASAATALHAQHAHELLVAATSEHGAEHPDAQRGRRC
jgi:hypothetical protein